MAARQQVARHDAAYSRWPSRPRPPGPGDWRTPDVDRSPRRIHRHSSTGVAGRQDPGLRTIRIWPGGAVRRADERWRADPDWRLEQRVHGGLSWTPDGREILFARPEMSGRRLLRVSAGGGEPAVAVPGIPLDSISPSVSHLRGRQGYRLAFVSGQPDLGLRLIDLQAHFRATRSRPTRRSATQPASICRDASRPTAPRSRSRRTAAVTSRCGWRAETDRRSAA